MLKKLVFLFIACSIILQQVTSTPTQNPKKDAVIPELKNEELSARFRLLEDDVIGSGQDDDFLTDGHNPGKRSIDMSSRCINLGGDSCSTGELSGSG